jgi:hypothetical protein
MKVDIRIFFNSTLPPTVLSGVEGYLMTLSVSRLHSVEWADNWWITDWEGSWRKRWWLNRRNYPGICPDGLSKPAKTLSRKPVSSYRDPKLVPPRYDFEVLPPREPDQSKLLVPGAVRVYQKQRPFTKQRHCSAGTRSWSATCGMACVNEQHRPALKADLTDMLSGVLSSLWGTNMRNITTIIMIWWHYTTTLPSTSAIPFHHQHAKLNLRCRVERMTRAQSKSKCTFSNVSLRF